MLEDRLMGAIKSILVEVGAELPRIEASVRSGTLLPSLAVDKIMALIGM